MLLEYFDYIQMYNKLLNTLECEVGTTQCQAVRYRPTLSNPRASCRPVEGCVRPSLGFRCPRSSLHTNNLS